MAIPKEFADLGAIEAKPVEGKKLPLNLEELGAVPAREQEPGFFEQAKSALGGAAHAVLGQLAPAQQFAQQAFQQAPEAFGGRAPPQVTGVPLGQPGTPAYRAGEFAGEYGPMIAGGARIAPALLKVGGKAIGKLGSRLLGREVKKTERSYNNTAHRIYSDLYDTPEYLEKGIGQENKLLGKEIKKNYDFHKKQSTKNYTDVLEKHGDKRIKEGRLVNKILEDDRFEKLFPKMGIVDKQAGKFLTNPNLREGHYLQSSINKRIGQEYGKADPDFDSIKYMEGIRKNIVNKLRKTGGKDYSRASKYHFKNVIPYTKEKAINNLVREGRTTANFANRLTKGELDSAPVQTANTIARHMSSEQKEKVLLPFLKGSANKPGVDALGNINPNVLLDSYKGLHVRGLRPFMTKQTEKYTKQLNELSNKLEREIKLRNRLRYGVSGAATTLGIGEIGKRVL